MERIKQELIQAVLDRRAGGMTQSAVGKELNISTSKVAYIEKQAALKNGHAERENAILREVDGIRGLVGMAWQAREDAIQNQQAIDRSVPKEAVELAIDAAIGASSAWRKLATELEKRNRISRPVVRRGTPKIPDPPESNQPEGL